MESLRHGYLPDAVDHNALGNIEIRGGVTDLRGEPEPACDGIREGVARDGRGTVVHGFAVRVRTSDLEAVAHPLLDTHRKGFVGGVGPESQEPDTPEVRVGLHIRGGVSRPK